LKSAAGGVGNLVLISGEAGIGKTTLCDAIAKESRTEGIPAVWARAWESPGAPLYWQWIQLVRSIQEILVSESFWIDSELANVPELIDKLRFTPPDSNEREAHEAHREPLEDPEVQRFRLFDSVLRILFAAAKVHPWLLVFDDCHAADESSLLLLEFLAKQVRQLRILLVITYREGELNPRSRNAELLANIAREGERITLRGFQESEVADFLETTPDLKKSPEIVHKLLDATEENPFFLHEIVALLEARSTGPERSSAWTLEEFEIPDRVGTAIRLRLELASESTRRALGAAATIGREFDERLLALLLRVDRDQVVKNLNEATTTGVIAGLRDRPGRYQFVHALFAEYLTRTWRHRNAGNSTKILQRCCESNLSTHLTAIFHKSHITCY
jgi:predicted ATPase